VILVLLFVAFLITLVSREPAVTGTVNGAADLSLDVLSHVALAVFLTLLLLVVRSIALGRYR
jgi:hypothetical protein